MEDQFEKTTKAIEKKLDETMEDIRKDINDCRKENKEHYEKTTNSLDEIAKMLKKLFS